MKISIRESLKYIIINGEIKISHNYGGRLLAMHEMRIFENVQVSGRKRNLPPQFTVSEFRRLFKSLPPEIQERIDEHAKRRNFNSPETFSTNLANYATNNLGENSNVHLNRNILKGYLISQNQRSQIFLNNLSSHNNEISPNPGVFSSLSQEFKILNDKMDFMVETQNNFKKNSNRANILSLAIAMGSLIIGGGISLYAEEIKRALFSNNNLGEEKNEFSIISTAEEKKEEKREEPSPSTIIEEGEIKRRRNYPSPSYIRRKVTNNYGNGASRPRESMREARGRDFNINGNTPKRAGRVYTRVGGKPVSFRGRKRRSS